MSCSSLRTTVVRSTSCGTLYCLNCTNKKRRGMFLSKHYEIPFAKECATPFPRGTPLGVVALWHFYWLNYINARRARHVPEQTYRRISLRRNVSCSSLYIIQLKRHRLHNVTRDDLFCFHCSNRTKVNDIAYGATTAKVMDWFC